MENKFFLSLFLGFSAILLLGFSPSFAGAPPGAGGGSAGGGYTTSSGLRAFHIDLGMYSPSLAMINDDLKFYGDPAIGGGTYFDLGFTISDRAMPSQKTLLAFAYWSGSSSRPNFTENLRLYMFHISPMWELTSLSNAISPDFRLSLGFTARDVVASLVDESGSSSYVAYIGMIFDAGPSLGLEYYPIRNSRNFSISANLDYIILNWNILPLNVSDYSNDWTGLVSFGDPYKNHAGKNMMVETNGPVFRLGVNFYY